MKRRIARRWDQRELDEFANTPDEQGIEALARRTGALVLALWRAKADPETKREQDAADKASLPSDLR